MCNVPHSALCFYMYNAWCAYTYGSNKHVPCFHVFCTIDYTFIHYTYLYYFIFIVYVIIFLYSLYYIIHLIGIWLMYLCNEFNVFECRNVEMLKWKGNGIWEYCSGRDKIRRRSSFWITIINKNSRCQNWTWMWW